MHRERDQRRRLEVDAEQRLVLVGVRFAVPSAAFLVRAPSPRPCCGSHLGRGRLGVLVGVRALGDHADREQARSRRPAGRRASSAAGSDSGGSGAKNISITGRASSGPEMSSTRSPSVAPQLEVQERAALGLGGDELAGALLDLGRVAQAHAQAGLGRRAVEQPVGGERVDQREAGGHAVGGERAGDREVRLMTALLCTFNTT